MKFAAIVKQYIYHEQPTDAEKPSDGVAIDSAEARTLRFLDSEMFISEKDRFREFHNYTLMCGQPLATVLLSPQAICKNCHKQLSLDPKPHPIVIYSLKGTYLGCRLTKFCQKCKLHQHYGYSTQGNEKTYAHDVLDLNFMLSNTAFDTELLKEWVPAIAYF